jgi:predicted enzyme related to lactoylglutathione lyase
MPKTDKHAPATPVWIDLMCDDTEKARAFYGQLFGWTFEVGPPESGPYVICFQGGARVAGMGKKPPGTPMPTAWTMYLAVDDADASVTQIKEAGGAVFMGPMDVFEEGRMAIAADPTGGVFGLWQPKRHTGFQVVNEPGAFAYTELYTRDLEKAKAFFTKAFGYSAVNMDGMPYVTLHLGADQKTVAGGIMQMDEKQFPPGVPSHWNVYLATTNTDETVGKVTSLGGQVMAPPFDSPYGRIAVVQDPQGAVFSLIKLSEKALAM